MAEELPSEFDLIVIGTGFPESCIAAAASRIGKTVLHIDSNEYYGGSWASFSLEGLNARLEDSRSEELRNGSYKWHVKSTADDQNLSPTSSPDSPALSWTQSDLLQLSRRFNLDLAPKILYSAGHLVQLLVASNICRYAEFRAVDRVCTFYNGELLSVPCSRSDVFNASSLSIIEKRQLMKFLTICSSYGEDKCLEDMAIYRGRTFREYLLQQKLTQKIVTCIVQAIAMCAVDATFEEGMERTQLFLHSLGRYGNTPFLFPMYGCGEIPQCFCRLCAVFGGTYCLNRHIEDISIDADTNCATVLVDERPIRARHIVSSHGNLPASLRQSDVGIWGQGHLVNCLSRGILLAAVPLGRKELNSGGGGVNLLRLLSEDGKREAILLQLSHFSGACPKGIFIFHLTTAACSDNPEADLEPFLKQVFDEPFSQLLYSAFFTLTARQRSVDSPQIDACTPIYCTAAPVYEVDYDRAIANAREIFGKMYGDSEFLPRAPDPEEIVLEGEDPSALNHNALPDDLRAQFEALGCTSEQMDTHEDDYSNCDNGGNEGCSGIDGGADCGDDGGNDGGNDDGGAD